MSDQTPEILDTCHLLELRCGNLLAPHHSLCHRFVQGESKGERVGAGIGDIQKFQKGGDVGLSISPSKAFRDVKNDIDRCLPQSIEQSDIPSQADDLVAIPFEDVFDGFDRFLCV